MLDKQELEKVFNRINFSKSGFITFSEFMIAAIPKNILLSEKYLAEMFAVLDNDMSGKISSSEVKKFLDLEGERTISLNLAEKIIS